MLVRDPLVEFLEVWWFGDCQSFRLNPGEHPIQLAGTSHLVAPALQRAEWVGNLICFDLEASTCFVDSVCTTSICCLRGGRQGGQGVSQSVVRYRIDGVVAAFHQQHTSRDGCGEWIPSLGRGGAFHPLSRLKERGAGVGTVAAHHIVFVAGGGHGRQHRHQGDRDRQSCDGESSCWRGELFHQRTSRQSSRAPRLVPSRTPLGSAHPSSAHGEGWIDGQTGEVSFTVPGPEFASAPGEQGWNAAEPRFAHA